MLIIYYLLYLLLSYEIEHFLDEIKYFKSYIVVDSHCGDAAEREVRNDSRKIETVGHIGYRPLFAPTSDDSCISLLFREIVASRPLCVSFSIETKTITRFLAENSLSSVNGEEKAGATFR